MLGRRKEKLVRDGILVLVGLLVLPIVLGGLQQAVKVLTRARGEPANIVVNQRVSLGEVDQFWRGVAQAKNAKSKIQQIISVPQPSNRLFGIGSATFEWFPGFSHGGFPTSMANQLDNLNRSGLCSLGRLAPPTSGKFSLGSDSGICLNGTLGHRIGSHVDFQLRARNQITYAFSSFWLVQNLYRSWMRSFLTYQDDVVKVVC